MFGYWKACPEDTKGAWGARAILRAGYVDIVPDRQSFKGDSQLVCSLFNAKDVLTNIRLKVKELWNECKLLPSEEEEFVLFEDSEVKVVGNTNASHGYLYLVGFVK